MVDGAFGEILTTCEKIRWVVERGEQALQPEYRDVGPLTIHKTARVEYQPLGVLAALVSWNYPFHNLYGQVISAIFAGNAIVVKVSEYATWSVFLWLCLSHIDQVFTLLHHDHQEDSCPARTQPGPCANRDGVCGDWCRAHQFGR